MAIAAAAIGAGIGAAGSIFSGSQSANAARENYKHRYQWQVKDLQKAGLNPMLAVTNGAPNVPQPHFPDVGEAAVKGASSAIQARLAKAQIQNVEADTQLKGSAQAVNIATARKASIDAGIAEAQLPWAPYTAQVSALNLDKQGALLHSQIQQIANQTVGVQLTNQQLERMQPLLIEAQQLINKGMSADMVQKVMDSKWYEAMGATDKYGPVLKVILGLIERATRVK